MHTSRMNEMENTNGSKGRIPLEPFFIRFPMASAGLPGVKVDCSRPRSDPVRAEILRPVAISGGKTRFETQ